MKKILIILAHPRTASFCGALADAYQNGTIKAGAEVRRINLRDLKFDPILWEGYQEIQALEPDLLKAQENIKWADRLVFVYPTWWGAMPALLKGFIDRVFLPSFAFKFKKDSPWWDKLLTGKSAHLIVTMDSPVLFHKIFIGAPGNKMMKKAILGFCGIKPVRITNIGNVKSLSDKQKGLLIEKIREIGETLN